MDNPFVYVPLIFVVGITGFVALMAGTYLPIRQIDHNLTVSKCHTFAEASGYQTKFVDFNFFSYDCLGKTSDGRWIPTDRLHDVNVESR
jgi:hypothetical protein